MSQQKNQKNIVVYNYEPHPKTLTEQVTNIQQSQIQPDDSPFNVSKILKVKQQQSNIFHLPQQDLVDYSKVTPNQNAEKILPFDMFWWNSQNLKENKKTDANNPIIPNVHMIQSRPQTAAQQRVSTESHNQKLTEQQFLQIQQQQYQQFLQLQQQQQQKPQQQQQLQQIDQQQQNPNPNPYDIIKEHNLMIETASFAVQDNNNQSLQQQQSNQLQNPAKVYDKVNNPNTELKQKNPNFSDVFGNGLEKYYQQKPQQNSGRKQQVEYMQESELYGAKYHQRQMLKGMSSQMDTHKYYDQMLDKQNQDQIKSKQPKSKSQSPQASPGKNLEQDEKLFPKPQYTEMSIRGMGKEINWEKLSTQLNAVQMQLADITVVKDKQGKIKQHKIIIKYFDQGNLQGVKQWVLTQGGRLVEERVLESEEEFKKMIQLKEGPKQRPLRIAEEKERLKQQKKRPQSAVPVQKQKK
ncbi:unnamed protein product (macronuclear) [Paramecium tetraurelia]|uniref:Uncharacterized protein n=1 Tax=Paramecium tetraurelia TaxID=5888 RepID=A0DHJ4_PARTE|nr:uncharacterized protein GSPATT00016898001 [Paramecium tetraurelia]CAK82511.1 unnamed protein product [Paramecium tetraurelia]|eukprot:XP_001449908.1 hypothetical protein (macronuclear) [Paramecium tetraurelia strain d4-2]